MSILDAIKKAKKKNIVENENLDDVTFQCALRNLGVSYESCKVLVNFDLDERYLIIKHAERGLKFWFEE